MPRGKYSLERREATFWAKVDKTSSDKGCWLWTGGKTPTGYGSFWTGTQLAYAHRLSWAGANMCPMPPARLKIDHICHVKQCVKPSHLRLVSFKQNVENRPGVRKDNRSGYTGVSWYTRRSKWVAYVTNQGKLHHLGYYETAQEAAEVARQGRLAHHTHNDLDRI